MSHPPLHKVPLPAEAFVLAGGRSTRMGRDKALILISGRPLIAIALNKLRLPFLPSPGAPRIAGSRPELASYAAVVEDLHPGCGPLSGIEAALAATTQPLNLFLPVDLPLLPGEFLAWMLLRAATTGALITFPRVNGRAQPLCAVYHRDLLPHITRSILSGEYKITRALDAALRESSSHPDRRRRPPQRDFDVFDIELLATTYPEMYAFSPVPLCHWFQNCNSPQDMETIASLQPG